MNADLATMVHSAAWRNWFGLTQDQSAAMQSAMSMARQRLRIQLLLGRDLAAMERDEPSPNSEGELVEAWGQGMYRMHYVVLFACRLIWLQEQYITHGISEVVLRDTLTDIPLWMDYCRERTGHYGLLNHGFIMNHFKFRLFKLGRLEYMFSRCHIPAIVYRHCSSGVVTALCQDGGMYTSCGSGAGGNGSLYDGVWLASLREDEAAVTGFPIHPTGHALRSQVSLGRSAWQLALMPGDPVVEVHIPAGARLDTQDVARSLRQSLPFFRDKLGQAGKALVCTSWLMDDAIAQMQPKGNIAAFQRCFYRVPMERATDEQMRERVFGDPHADVLTSPSRTSLQGAVAAWYAAGRRCGKSCGFMLPEQCP